MMKALTYAGVGYTVTKVPQKIMTFRPYVPGNQCTHMVGGVWKAIKALKNRKFNTTSKPDSTTFVTDKDERERADCLPEAIIATNSSLYWQYPEKFLSA
jgi:hypothetical protein